MLLFLRNALGGSLLSSGFPARLFCPLASGNDYVWQVCEIPAKLHWFFERAAFRGDINGGIVESSDETCLLVCGGG